MEKNTIKKITNKTNMTAKEKAKLLFKMYHMIVLTDEKAKQCALITVNEIINSKTLDIDFYIKTKQEIQKL